MNVVAFNRKETALPCVPDLPPGTFAELVDNWGGADGWQPGDLLYKPSFDRVVNVTRPDTASGYCGDEIRVKPMLPGDSFSVTVPDRVAA